MNLIGIFGWEQTDICIYLASILENMGYHILVIDNSKDLRMDCCIPRPEQELHTITYKNVDYRRQIPYQLWKDADYDLVIVDIGEEISQEEAWCCDELFLVTNCDRRKIQAARNLMLQIKRPMSVVIRNWCKEILTSQRIFSELREENCFVMDCFWLPFYTGDESRRILMQYEGYENFCHISKEFERMLFQISSSIVEESYSCIFQGLRRAKKGECH